jgi:tetratricopeptide (TPR) repeat protein
MTFQWLRRAIAPNALAVASPDDDRTQEHDAADPEALNRQVEQLYLAGNYVEATELAKHALAHAGPVVAKSLNNLATLYFVQGCDIEAEPLFKRALAILKKALGPDHPAVAAAHRYLAELQIEQGGLAPAGAYLRRNLEAASLPPSSVTPPQELVPRPTPATNGISL